MRRSKVFHHDNLCIFRNYENQHKLVFYTDSGSEFEFEIELVANYLPSDSKYSDYQCIISSLPMHEMLLFLK